MAIEEDLDLIERSIRQLHIEWDRFFGGLEKKPPSDLKARVEALLKRYANVEIRNNTVRFRYQGLQARYNTFSELWAKRLRAMEEGRPLVGQAHRPAPPPPPPGPAASAPAAGDAAAGQREVRVKDPVQDSAAVRRLYEGFLEARKQTGEAANVKFESFQKLISQQAARILAEKGAAAIDFRLEMKDGKVSLKAKPVR